ncbi:unnamed protein product, partial [Prorocentrum cordatum]
VCISYLTEDGLLQCASMRRWDLHETKHFWCTCERCGGEKDFSRGFRCPKCEEGAIFSRTPAPGAASSAALQPEELVNESCSSCKFKVTKKEAERLTKLERTLRVSIDKYAEQKRADEAVALKSFRATEEIIDASFFQHALADLMWEKLADYYAQHQRSSDHRRLLERRCAFHEAAYPGLSAAHAWCLEGFADALKKEPSATQAPPVVTDAVARGSWAKADRLRWQKAAKAEPEEAARLYTQAHDILRLMFGESHEYVTGGARGAGGAEELAQEKVRRGRGRGRRPGRWWRRCSARAATPKTNAQATLLFVHVFCALRPCSGTLSFPTSPSQ